MNILDFPNYKLNTNGEIYNIESNTILNGYIHKSKHTNYRLFSLMKDNKIHTLKLHRLLAKAFIPNPNNHPCVDHKDGNGLNNHLDNLRWSSRSENQQNKEVQKNNKLGIKNICYHIGNNKYQFKKEYNKEKYVKYFKTLEAAIECKNEWYNNHQDEFLVKNKRDEDNLLLNKTDIRTFFKKK